MPVSMVIFVNGVVPMEVSSLQIVFHIPSIVCLNLDWMPGFNL